MTPKQKVLSIRLAELIIKNHTFAKSIGLEVKNKENMKVKDLAQIVLEMLSSLNSMKKSQERLIEITADGIIEDDEIRDFVQIQKELEHISITVETLQLWVEEMIADNKIDIEKYNKIKEEV